MRADRKGPNPGCPGSRTRPRRRTPRGHAAGCRMILTAFGPRGLVLQAAFESACFRLAPQPLAFAVLGLAHGRHGSRRRNTTPGCEENPAAAHNSRDGRKKSPDAFRCVTTPPGSRTIPQPWRRTRCSMAAGPADARRFRRWRSASACRWRASGWDRHFCCRFAPCQRRTSPGTPAPGSTAGYTAVPGTSGRIPSANNFATPADPHWPKHPCQS